MKTVASPEVIEHHGETFVRGRYDGDFDKTHLPDELILTNYFTVRAGKIVTLIVIRNTPAYCSPQRNDAIMTIASTSGLDVAKEWLVSSWLATVGARYGVGVAVAR